MSGWSWMHWTLLLLFVWHMWRFVAALRECRSQTECGLLMLQHLAQVRAEAGKQADRRWSTTLELWRVVREQRDPNEPMRRMQAGLRWLVREGFVVEAAQEAGAARNYTPYFVYRIGPQGLVELARRAGSGENVTTSSSPSRSDERAADGAVYL